jgi:hypothetical protein
MRTSIGSPTQAEATGNPVSLNRAALLVGVTWWGLGIAAAFGAYFAIVVHEYRSADSAFLQWESSAGERAGKRQCSDHHHGRADASADKMGPREGNPPRGVGAACPMKRSPVG